MFTDMVGYSALMQRDEALGLNLVKEQRALFRPMFATHGGNEIKNTGDGFLVEFTSALDAMRCAIDLQQALHDRNSGVPTLNAILVRIGIHLGDVDVQEGDVYGDGVNIAARIEPLADAGGIAVSQQVFDQVHNKISERLIRLGEAELKNIRTPIAVYKVALPWTVRQTALIERWKFSLRKKKVRFALGASLVLALLVASAIGWRQNFFRAPQPAPQTSSVDVGRVKSIAILPFRRLDTKTAEDEYLGVGLADALITQLSNIQQLVVRPTSAIQRYDKSNQDSLAAGKEQGVEALIEGTIQKSGQRLRLAVRLLRVRDGASLWSGRFDADATDLFRMEDSIAEQVTQALLLKLTGEERTRMNRRYTDNADAYQRYLQGRFYWNKFNEAGFKKALGFFEEALKFDPNYAPAYAGIAETYSGLMALGFATPEAALVKAKAAAEKALAIDDGLADAHQALGGIKLLIEWDWAGGERELKRALAINPNLATSLSLKGYYLQAMGRAPEALVVARTAAALDPLSPVITVDLACAFYFVKQYDEAKATFERALELDPTFVASLFVPGQALERKGEYSEAIQRSLNAIKVSGRDPGIIGVLGYAYASAGKRAEALAIVRELEARWKQQHFPASIIALAYAGLKDRDQAFRWMETAFREHDAQLLWFRVDPQLDPLRDDSRFVSLMRRMGLDS